MIYFNDFRNPQFGSDFIFIQTPDFCPLMMYNHELPDISFNGVLINSMYRYTPTRNLYRFNSTELNIFKLEYHGQNFIANHYFIYDEDRHKCLFIIGINNIAEIRANNPNQTFESDCFSSEITRILNENLKIYCYKSVELGCSDLDKFVKSFIKKNYPDVPVEYVDRVPNYADNNEFLTFLNEFESDEFQFDNFDRVSTNELIRSSNIDI